jgi:acyl-CoA reductase-like NAD-dependent aldehyde dehydrogenase
VIGHSSLTDLPIAVLVRSGDADVAARVFSRHPVQAASHFERLRFGGYKQSGIGKELGIEGLVNNTELKSVFVSTER